jgi:diguanylate cyclase
MRKYLDTREASGELLRLVIPKMAQHSAGCHPVSYALWYEYISGRNPALKDAVDAALRESGSLDNQTVNALYLRFIADPDAAAADRLHADLQRVMGELSQHAATAGTRAGEYNHSLGQYGEQLSKGVDAGELGGVVQSLLKDTQQMRSSAETLQGQLQESTHQVEELRAELALAKGEAQTDPLTGIRNRRGLELAIERAQAPGGPGLAGSCLIVLDIDHFKKCNDAYGHLFGDKVIRSVAQVMAGHVKGQDTAARIGGEEFAILLPDTPLEGARTLAERLRATIQKGRIRRGDASEMVGNITVSLGVATHCPGEEFEAFMRRADEALYESKRSGRNRVTVAEPPPLVAVSRAA